MFRELYVKAHALFKFNQIKSNLIDLQIAAVVLMSFLENDEKCLLAQYCYLAFKTSYVAFDSVFEHRC